MTHTMFRFLTASLTLTFAGLLLTGCVSADRRVYVSTPFQPKTITLIDALSDKDLWSLEIPVGFKLELDLDREGENELRKISRLPATRFTWRLQDLKGNTHDSGEVELPNTEIRIEMTLRSTPEYPNERTTPGQIRSAAPAPRTGRLPLERRLYEQLQRDESDIMARAARPTRLLHSPDFILVLSPASLAA